MTEESDEEILVYMDFNSKLDDDIFKPEKEFKIIGINEEEPILQLGNQVFQGEWKDALGTNILFEESDCPSKRDSMFSEDVPTLQYVAKTNKLLHMSRVFMNPKDKEKPEEKETASGMIVENSTIS